MIGSTPLPGAGDSSAPAYDDTALVERLDVLEANRSASTAYRPELRSRVGGLTLASSIEAIVPVAGFFALYVQTPTDEIAINGYFETLQEVVDDLSIQDYEGFLEALIDDGHFVIRPADPTAPFHITTFDPDSVLEAFDVDETWFGQDVYPRPEGTYDTTSTNVRLVGPAGAYAAGSGQSVSTALEALKRLHHSSEIVIEDREFYVVPDGLDPETATLGQIGAALGENAELTWVDENNFAAYGEPITITDLNETVVSFMGRIPGISGVYAERNATGSNVIAFYAYGVPWELTSPNGDGYGYVRISSPVFPRYPGIRRVLARSTGDDVALSAYFSRPDSQFSEYASGRLSTIVGLMLTEINSLRARVAALEAGA